MLGFYSFTPINLIVEFEYRGNHYPADWEHTYGLGKVVYLQSGHNINSFQPKDYRQLVKNSVTWASV
jgi:type 1 glutamine amidotransferase